MKQLRQSFLTETHLGMIIERRSFLEEFEKGEAIYQGRDPLGRRRACLKQRKILGTLTIKTPDMMKKIPMPFK